MRRSPAGRAHPAFLTVCFLAAVATVTSTGYEESFILRQKRAASDTGFTLTFVFDSTGSMSDELSQVKEAMRDIFNHMKLHRADEIANYALVEFNDPYANLLTITDNADVYQRNLNNIRVHGGGDCAEMSMKGIKIALEKSLPNSYIFVFTDASAKDFAMQAEVENLIQRKKSKVIFVLTGECSGRFEPGYLVYNRVAEVSNGQVFNLLKNEVKEVLKYVKVDTGRKGVVNSGNLPSYKKTAINTPVDESMKNLVVTVTGKRPKIELTDPAGKKEEGETILDLDSVKSKTVKNPKPGNWTVNVQTKTPGRFVIMTESSFNFIYGFSLNPTDNMAGTAPRPLIGRDTFLLIQVTNQSNLIHLIDVKIKDTKENVIRTMTLYPVRGKNGTYKVDMFPPPTSVFLLEVSGKDSKGNTITRVSDSGITPQSPAPPIITLSTELTATLKLPFTLTCHVESLVPFTASWYKGTENIMPDKRYLQSAQVPYNISNTQISSGGIYTCKARNDAGSVSKNVKLNVKVPPPLVKTPKTIELRAGEPGKIPCQVESEEDYTVSWSKKTISGVFQPITGSKFITKPTGDLVISSTEKSDEGDYKCTANSIFGSGESNIFAIITEPVQVTVVSDKRKFRSQEHFQLKCTASGTEPITLVWKKNGVIFQESDRKLKRPEKNELLLKIRYAQKADEGTYECEARNKINKATEIVEMIYLERPKVKILPSSSQPYFGRYFTLQCYVTGHPKPTISWTKDGKKILSGDNEQVFSNGTLVIPSLLFNHTGQYQCSAENEVGRVDAIENIEVVSKPQFHVDKNEFYIDIYKNGTIECNVIGHPPPTISWERKDGKPITERFSQGPSCSKVLTRAEAKDEGIYIVTAVNKFGVQTMEFSLRISGMEKPVLVHGNTEEVSIAGNYKELTCLIEKGKPPPILTWYKDGEILDLTDLSATESKIYANGSLIFSFIKPDNEGTYDCEASNAAGKTRRRLNLKVYEVPVFIDDKHVILKGRLGTAVPLSCEAYGNPKPRITWMKDGKLIRFSSTMALNTEGDSLLILSTTFENNGTYECVAENIAGKNKKTIELVIQDAPHIIPPSSTDIYIEKGKDLALLCEVEAFPVAEIKWYKNGSPYETDSVTHSDNNSTIRLSTDLSSTGEYTCIATNEAGHDKIALNVTVTVPPFFENTEEYIQASRGDNVTLSCYTDAIPPPYYYWLKYPDTEPILSDSMITLENVDDTFAGLYRCDVSNIAGDAQKTIILSIYVPPLILADIPETEFLRKGQYFNTPCYATGDPNPTIRWLKDGKPLLLEDENLLEINNVTEEDAGIYTCVAENYEGTDEKNMKIIVGVHPELDEAYPKKIYANESKSVIVSCPAIRGIPTPNVQWLKDGIPLSLTDRVLMKDKNRSLKIKKAKQSDEGTYTCLASNTIGEAQADISLSVLIPPRFLNGTTKIDINQLRGTHLLFDCSNSGKPTPKVSWYRNNHPFLPELNLRARISSAQVMIFNSTHEDQAEYKCTVENKAGQIERTFNVKVFVYAEEEGYIPADERLGKWSSWSPWSACTAPCGKSEKVRFRKCSSETGACDGESEEWQQCLVGNCKVDGDWGQWGNWSTCSSTCGMGVRFRERLCNNPPPQHGGNICYGTNRQHESCNTNPCPVDGSWSAWSAWQTCSGPCSNSTSKRIRKCTNPSPAFGGKACSGLKVEYKSCIQEKCPVHGGWSKWSPWSPCSATCGHSTSFRERLCNNPKPKLNGIFCSGPSRETRKCETELCDKIPLHATVLIRGFLNGHTMPETTTYVNITDTSGQRLIEARASNPFRRKATIGWYPFLSLVVSPITWLTAFQKDEAINGFTLTKGIFKMETFVKFTSGEEVTINHIGEGVDLNGTLKLLVDIQGRTPQFPNGSPVKIEPYQEDYIQSGLGELFASASNSLQGGGTSTPYSWNKTIQYNAEQGKLPTLVETLSVQNIKIKRVRQKEEGSISTKPVALCPKGFELTDEEYCQDIDECSSRRLHNCHFTQKCVNYKGSYSCTCPPGFKASVKGGQCIDVNECTMKPSICSHKCVNLEGSFKCLCPPSLTLLDSKTNCSSILPTKVTKEGEIGDWKHCLTNQIIVDGMCEDKNPCQDNEHICGEEGICVNMHGLYKCIAVPCPPNFERVKNTKSCIKYCNKIECDSDAKISETIIPIVVTPGGPIAPYKDLVHLPLNVEKSLLSHTSFQIMENEKGKPFRVKNPNGEGIIYSTVYLPPGEEYRITVQALTYDDSHTDILYSNKFTVIILSPAE